MKSAITVTLGILAILAILWFLWYVSFDRFAQPPSATDNLPAGAQFVYYDPQTHYRLIEMGGCLITQAYEYHQWHLSYVHEPVCPAGSTQP